MYRASLTLTAIGAAFALTLVSCSAVPSPEESSPPSASPSPGESESETPTPSATALRVEPDAIVVLDGDTELDRISFLDATADAVAALTEVLGADPTVAPTDGGLTAPAGTGHTWPGLTLIDPDGAGESLRVPEFWVTIDAASSGSIALTSLDGVSVGSPLASIQSTLPPDERNAFIGLVPTGETDVSGEVSVSVWAIGSDDGTVAELRAPSPDCCGE